MLKLYLFIVDKYKEKRSFIKNHTFNCAKVTEMYGLVIHYSSKKPIVFHKFIKHPLTLVNVYSHTSIISPQLLHELDYPKL